MADYSEGKRGGGVSPSRNWADMFLLLAFDLAAECPEKLDGYGEEYGAVLLAGYFCQS